MSITSDAPGGRVRRVVAGVDGSSRSEAVVAWAADQARRTGARLTVVLGWTVPTLRADLPARVESELSEAAEKRVAELVASVGPDVPVESVVQEGGPVRLLLREASGADLLVLGRHGEGREADDAGPGKALGSVVQACASHAPCATVVVPTG